MSMLSDSEKAQFMELAAAYIANTERMEHLQEEARKEGKVQGDIALDPKSAGHKLFNFLVPLFRRQRGLTGIRFRGHLFVVTQSRDKTPLLAVVKERMIEAIDG